MGGDWLKFEDKADVRKAANRRPEMARDRGQGILDWNEATFDYSPFVDSDIRNPFFRSSRGALWAGDCLDILPKIVSDRIDTVFADPPFNLGKEYGKSCADDMAEEKYLAWCRAWMAECIRVLKPGGALFVYHLPRWNVSLGAALLEMGMTFRHWIAMEIGGCLPIPGRLYPAHYGLLYFAKGKPKTFRRIRTPILKCRHCGGEIKNYGGPRKELNPKGLNLKDVWTDISPVCHSKFKDFEARPANALSTKILDRVVEMSTRKGDIVLDPFGGSGTTFAVCEAKNRRWLGIEIDSAAAIAKRLTADDLAHHLNDDVVDED